MESRPRMKNIHYLLILTMMLREKKLSILFLNFLFLSLCPLTLFRLGFLRVAQLGGEGGGGAESARGL